MAQASTNKSIALAASRMADAISAGLQPLYVAAPQRLSQWAEENFYLSAESSYTEGRWKAYPFQIGILDCMGNDAIVEVDVPKSARVGYTKCLLAAIGYFAEHKKRNQALWQPTDEDRDEFVKVELEPMLRDVPVMEKIFPAFLQRHKDNTLKAKKFLTGMLHLRGGKAAKNYRRISVDVVHLDELDGFDLDIEGEGRPFQLAKKRLEGAIFPKIIAGTTPKTANLSHIEERTKQAQEVFQFQIPCPHCGHRHPLVFGRKGEKKEPYGLIWRDSDPETVGHLCPGCGVIYTQAEYLTVWHLGRWTNPNTGTWLDDETHTFRDVEGTAIRPPEHVAFHVWTAYSPQATWPAIVKEWLNAVQRAAIGDKTTLKTVVNTTLGETYEEDVEKGDAEALISRVEPFPLRIVPRGALVLVAFVDVQGDRFELVVWGIGPGEEMWTVDYRIIDDVNPLLDTDWERLDPYLEARYKHARGGTLPIEIVGIDTGYATHHAYRYCRTRQHRKIYATKGDGADKIPIKGKRALVDVKQRTGQPIKNGVKLFHIGTDAAKDVIWGRLHVEAPGPGYMHFSSQLPPAFFHQLVSEVRVSRPAGGAHVYKWIKPNQATRNEVLDCTVGALWGLEMLLERYKDPAVFWRERESRIADPDLFAVDETEPVSEAPPVAVPTMPSRPSAPISSGGINLTGWARGR